MTDIRLATTPAAGLRRLAAHGQPVVGAHRQLVAILGNRLSRQHAQLLARPEIDAGDGRVDWYAPPLGAARRLDEMPSAERQTAESSRRQLMDEIGRLAATMRAEGESGALVAHMLDLALITPPGALVWVIGTQPVLVDWGHADAGQVVPEPPASRPPAIAPAPPPAPPRPLSSAPPSTAAPAPPEAPPPSPAAPVPPAEPAPAVTAAMGAPAAGRGWLAWLLPLLLLLLLAYLVWRALQQPLPPVVVEHQAPPPPAADPVAAEVEAETALRAELAKLTQERDRQLALCKPVVPPPPPPPPVVAPPQKEEALPAPEPKKPEPAPKAELKKQEPAPKAEAKKAEPAPKPAPKATAPAPKPEVKTPEPKAEPKPKPPEEPEAPKDVALAPPVPPSPPKSACSGGFPPGDEPEVVVIVDGSGSMREPYAGASSRMALAKDAIASVVNGLPAPVDVALVDFSDCDRVRTDKFYSAPQRGSLIGEVRGLQPDRGTPLARSIERAGNILSSGVESTIVVVSDGADTCGRDPCAAARAVKAKRPNVAINVIDVSGGDGAAMAQCIAGATGGKVLTPNSPMDMKNKVQQATRLPNCK